MISGYMLMLRNLRHSLVFELIFYAQVALVQCGIYLQRFNFENQCAESQFFAVLYKRAYIIH